MHEGTPISYHTNPPTSGDHWPRPVALGIYDFPLPDEQIVHNLEHGAIWISYNGIDDKTKQALENIAKKYPNGVVMTPRSENDKKIALASWGYLDKFDDFNEKRVVKFIISNINNSPEPIASLDKSMVAVGMEFPEFSVKEVSGKTITNESLKGKPAIVWLTTSWCTPCKIGAEKVAKLDTELGDDAFNVLVVFVDHAETDSDLKNWRNKYANKDWAVAFDNEFTNLGKKVELRYLDSKFLLDKNGIIKNIDVKIADEKYLNLIYKTINEDI